MTSAKDIPGIAPFLVISTDLLEISTCIHKLPRSIVPSVGSPETNWKRTFPALQEDERFDWTRVIACGESRGKEIRDKIGYPSSAQQDDAKFGRTQTIVAGSVRVRPFMEGWFGRRVRPLEELPGEVSGMERIGQEAQPLVDNGDSATASAGATIGGRSRQGRIQPGGRRGD